MTGELLDVLASYREKGIKLDSIVTHVESVVPQWGFLVFFDNKLYFMIRKSELPKLGKLARKMPDLFDVPIVEDRTEVSRISRGIFIWTRKMEEL